MAMNIPINASRLWMALPLPRSFPKGSVVRVTILLVAADWKLGDFMLAG